MVGPVSRAERARLVCLFHVAATGTCPFAEIPPVARARLVLPHLVGEVGYAPRTRADACATLRAPGTIQRGRGVRPERPSHVDRTAT